MTDTLPPRPSPLFVYFTLFFTLPFQRAVGIDYSNDQADRKCEEQNDAASGRGVFSKQLPAPPLAVPFRSSQFRSGCSLDYPNDGTESYQKTFF